MARRIKMPNVPLLHQNCNSLSSSFFNLSSPSQNFILFTHSIQISCINLTITPHNKCLISKAPHSSSSTGFPKTHVSSLQNPLPRRRNRVCTLCSSDSGFGESTSIELPERPENPRYQEIEELELLGKPSPVPVADNGGPAAELVVSESKKPKKDEALAPFLKFFKGNKPDGDDDDDDGGLDQGLQLEESEAEEELNVKKKKKKISVRYYEPKPGDFVVGVVVSGNENKLDVNVGADLLGTMLTKEVLPLYDKELSYLLCDLGKDGEFMSRGKMGVVRDEEALGGGEAVAGRPVVEIGTVLFAEVLGRTLSGRPLLSTRRLFRRVAWHRVRQMKQLNEPLQVRITEWNTGGLLTRIEGLRAFLPKAELMGRVNNFKELKENVGRQICVQINRIDEANNDLIISEREAWEMLHLKEGTLLEGTVWKIFPYGAQVRIGDTNRSGLLHISNISRSRISAVSDLLTVDEKVKVLVVKSMFPDKISFSTAELESEPGLFLSNKEKVFAEADEMAKKYREKLSAVSTTRNLDSFPNDVLPFNDEAKLYSNWEWFKFERENETN